MRFEIPLPPIGKARPRVTRYGTYMPEKYAQWKRDFGALCYDIEPLAPGPFAIAAVFRTKTGRMRCDLDNAIGAVLDALQDASVIGNDRDAVKLSAEVLKGPLALIEIELLAI